MSPSSWGSWEWESGQARPLPHPCRECHEVWPWWWAARPWCWLVPGGDYGSLWHVQHWGIVTGAKHSPLFHLPCLCLCAFSALFSDTGVAALGPSAIRGHFSALSS